MILLIILVYTMLCGHCSKFFFVFFNPINFFIKLLPFKLFSLIQIDVLSFFKMTHHIFVLSVYFSINFSFLLYSTHHISIKDVTHASFFLLIFCWFSNSNHFNMIFFLFLFILYFAYIIIQYTFLYISPFTFFFLYFIFVYIS